MRKRRSLVAAGFAALAVAMASGAGYAGSAPAQPADRPLGMAAHRSMMPDHGSMMSPRQMRRHMRSERMREMHRMHRMHGMHGMHRMMMGGAERRGGMGMGMEGMSHPPGHPRP